MEQKIKITETLLKQARVLRNSRDPQEAIAAAEWEMRFEQEIDLLRKREKRSAAAKAAA